MHAIRGYDQIDIVELLLEEIADQMQDHLEMTTLYN
jgi:hypothetical protein